MSGFAALMALSASQTKKSAVETESLLAERRRKEEQRRKDQEERERRERETQRKLLQKKFEDEQRERERQVKAEEARREREALIQQREDEQRHNLLYGTKASKTRRAQSHDSRMRSRRSGSPDSDAGGGSVLTREEKRQRKLEVEMNRANGSKRSSTSHRPGRRLAGGVLDTASDISVKAHLEATKGGKSVKQRIAALPMTLTRLNVNKRDTRTIDEILQDRAKAREGKVLDGEEARHFDDWFSSPKKSTSAQQSVTPSPPRNVAPLPARKSASHSEFAKASKPIAPASNSKLAPSNRETSRPGALKDNRSSTSNGKAAVKGSSSSSKLPAKTGASSSMRTSTSLPALSKKRARSPSMSLSPPPSKKRSMDSDDLDSADISSTIWQMFGKNRSAYVQRDVFSDDEDMEVGAGDLEREEMRSARLAKKEDERALEEEKRHEEEKRRKRKERELREKRGF